MASGNNGSVDQKAVCSYYQRDCEQDSGDVRDISIEKLSLAPRKKLLVLDLSGVICDRVFQENKASIPKNRTPDAASGSFLVYKRPYSEEFLKFCFESWNLGFCKKDQDQCTNSGFHSLENKNRRVFFKELKKQYSNLPECRRQFSSSNTLLIDDNPCKAFLNPPYTAIFPTEYRPDDVNDTALGPNGVLRLYLDGLAEADDVPTYVKENPFGQPAITAIHPDWDYYSKIIHCHGKERVTGNAMN